MDPNHINIHVHLMFSDRMLEEDRNISIEKFFKRHSRKKPELLFAVPKKQRVRWIRKTNWLRGCRKDRADLVNEKYKENEIDKKIDHRRLDEIKKEKDGQLIDANYYDRKPRKRLGRKIMQSPAIVFYL